MPKVQKSVINSITFLIIVLFSNSYYSYAQTVNDDYILLYKVAHINSNLRDTIFKLRERGYFSKEPLKNYYKLKILKEKPFNPFESENEKDSKIQKRNDSLKEYFIARQYSNFDILNRFLSKKDFEYLLSQDNEIIWQKSTLNKNMRFLEAKQIIKEVVLLFDFNEKSENVISKPMYSLSGKYALITLKKGHKITDLYIFKREQNDWVKIGFIEQYI